MDRRGGDRFRRSFSLFSGSPRTSYVGHFCLWRSFWAYMYICILILWRVYRDIDIEEALSLGYEFLQVGVHSIIVYGQENE